MSRPRKSMKEIRSICTIKLQNPIASTRFIAKATRCSRPVVQKYLDKLEQFPLSLEALHAMNDQKLATHLQLTQRDIQETDANRTLLTRQVSNSKQTDSA
jgi:hypothetical protein